MAIVTKLADQIREFAVRHYIRPARQRGAKTVAVRVGEVRQQLKLANRTPAICSALSSRKFLQENSLEWERREGPPSGQSTTVVYTYRFRDSRARAEGSAVA